MSIQMMRIRRERRRMLVIKSRKYRANIRGRMLVAGRPSVGSEFASETLTIKYIVIIGIVMFSYYCLNMLDHERCGDSRRKDSER